MSERDQEIVRRYLAGETLRSVGAAFGISRERIRQITVVAGVWRKQDPSQHLPRPRGPRGPHNRAIYDAALAGYGVESASKIAARHGVTKNVIIGHWNRQRVDGLIGETRPVPATSQVSSGGVDA